MDFFRLEKEKRKRKRATKFPEPGFEPWIMNKTCSQPFLLKLKLNPSKINGHVLC